MALVAPGVCRYVVEADYSGQDHFNIFDINISDVGAGSDRDDVIPFIAGDLLNQWSDHILPLLNPQMVAQRVSWVDLDSLTGTTGARSSTDGSTWPEAGSQTGDGLPGNVCMRMRKNITGSRGRRAGQLRLGGMSEGYTLGGTPNAWDPAAQTLFNDAFEDLKDGINGGGLEGPINYTANIVVVHTIDDVYVAKSTVTTFQAVGTIGSIRRRLPGYGT